MKKKKWGEKYESLGFVESLIAIMVSGIVATVLMNIAAASMRDLVRLDIEDAQAHHARSAAVILQNMANKERLQTDDDNLFDSLAEGVCYALNRDENGEYDINPAVTLPNRDSYITDAIIHDGVNDNEEDYFRAICVVKKRPGDPPSNKLLVKIIIGFNKASGLFSTSSDIKDYQYFAIINL
jgi:type II secretory pathway pseudopilin PulG